MMPKNEIIKQESDYMMPTYARYPVALVSGKGVRVTDSDGKTYMDLGSGIGVNSLGYCDEGWVKAISGQAATLQHASNYYYQPVQTALAEALCKCAGMDKVFFTNSGAEANEAAIKLARKYSCDKYGENRNEIVTLANSFHGRTVTTLSATGQPDMHKHFFPFTEGFVFAEANNFADVLEKVSEKTCGIFLELIQGEGGVLPLSREFVKQVATLCEERDLLLMIDEVQTGVGRTGTFYCYEQYGVKPDVVTSAKGLGGGLPIGACLCSEKLSGVLSAGVHGSTYGGNPVACAGALEVVKRVGEENFLNIVAAKGMYIKNRLEEMENVAEVRSKGLMIGITLKTGSAKEAAKSCLEKGLLVLTAKENVRLLPPLTITYEELDEALNTIETVFRALTAGKEQGE